MRFKVLLFTIAISLWYVVPSSAQEVPCDGECGGEGATCTNTVTTSNETQSQSCTTAFGFPGLKSCGRSKTDTHTVCRNPAGDITYDSHSYTYGAWTCPGACI